MPTRPTTPRKPPRPAAKKATSATKPHTPSPGGEIFARWRAGARISELVTEFKLTRPQVRKQIMLGAGSREALAMLRKGGAGGPIKPIKVDAPKRPATEAPA